MSRYTVFLPAPSFKELQRNVDRTWVTGNYVLDVPSDQPSQQMSQNEMDIDANLMEDTERNPFLPFRKPRMEQSMMDASLILSQSNTQLYDGAIIDEGDLDEEYAFSQAGEISKDSDAYDWPTSTSGLSASQNSAATQERSGIHQVPPTSSYPHMLGSLDTSLDENSSVDITRDSSDASIARLPTFRIPINQLASLKNLVQPQAARTSSSTKVTILVGVLEIDGPDFIRIKKGIDAGLEVALLKLVIGDTDGGICKLTVWRELAEEWANELNGGDVVLLQDIMFSRNADGTSSCTASKHAKSTAIVCYRTVQLTAEDKQLRPDLRLEAFDPAIAKVAQVVRWVQRMRG